MLRGALPRSNTVPERSDFPVVIGKGADHDDKDDTPKNKNITHLKRAVWPQDIIKVIEEYCRYERIKDGASQMLLYCNEYFFRTQPGRGSFPRQVLAQAYG